MQWDPSNMIFTFIPPKKKEKEKKMSVYMQYSTLVLLSIIGRRNWLSMAGKQLGWFEGEDFKNWGNLDQDGNASLEFTA